MFHAHFIKQNNTSKSRSSNCTFPQNQQSQQSQQQQQQPQCLVMQSSLTSSLAGLIQALQKFHKEATIQITPKALKIVAKKPTGDIGELWASAELVRYSSAGCLVALGLLCSLVCRICSLWRPKSRVWPTTKFTSKLTSTSSTEPSPPPRTHTKS